MQSAHQLVMNCPQPTISWKCYGKCENEIYVNFQSLLWHSMTAESTSDELAAIYIHNGTNLIKHCLCIDNLYF